MGQKACYFCGTTQIDVQNVLSVVCKHTRSLDNGGIPVSHTLLSDLRAALTSPFSNVLCCSPHHHRKALWKHGLALTHSCSAVLLFLKSVYSRDEEFVKWIFYVFFSKPYFFSMLFRDGIGRAHRAERTALALRTAGGAVLAAEQHQPVAEIGRLRRVEQLSQGIFDLTGSFSFLTKPSRLDNGCSAYRTQ